MRLLLRRFLIVVFVLLLPLAGYALWDYIELRRLIREIDAIRAKGEPLTERGVVRDYEHLPENQRRAGDYYLAAAALAVHTTAPAAVGPVHLWLVHHGQTERMPPAKLMADLRTVVDASPEALTLADKAAVLPFAGLPPGSETGMRYNGLNRLTALIGARSLALGLAGRGDEAVDSIRSAMAVKRAMVDRGWTPMEDYEIPAVLSLSTPSAAALRRLEETLAATPAPLEPAQQLLVMRAEFLRWNWREYYGLDPQVPLLYTLPGRSLDRALVRPIVTQRLVRSLQTWAAMIPAVEQSGGRVQIVEEIAKARAEAPPELEAAVARTRIYVATAGLDRCLRTLVAIERYRRDHAGALPASLTELVPQYVSAVPIDPVDDAPLRFRTQAEAYVVYSVGLDQKDDGGDVTSGVRPDVRPEWAARTVNGRDLGVRVLLRPSDAVAASR